MDPGASTSRGIIVSHPPYIGPGVATRPEQGGVYHVGIYGWRKRCLYMFVLLIMIMVILNMALTIWMLRVMDFNVHGMGKLRILENGIKVDGDATFLKALYATNIRSLKTSALNITSSKNISINTRNKDNSIENKVFIDDRKFVVYAKKFQVRGIDGKKLLSVADETVTLGAHTLEIDGEGGTTFKSSVETPYLRSHLNSDLRLESPTGGLYIRASNDVSVHTPVGDVKILSYSDITMQSLNRAILLEAQNISLQGLPVSPPDTGRGHYTLVYQLCVCGNNGKLFLSQAEGHCVATKEICS